MADAHSEKGKNVFVGPKSGQLFTANDPHYTYFRKNFRPAPLPSAHGRPMWRGSAPPAWYPPAKLPPSLSNSAPRGSAGHAAGSVRDTEARGSQPLRLSESAAPRGPISLGERLLRKSGWKSGDGLGKSGDGIRDAVVAEERHGRLGLGFERGGNLNLESQASVSSSSPRSVGGAEKPSTDTPQFDHAPVPTSKRVVDHSESPLPAADDVPSDFGVDWLPANAHVSAQSHDDVSSWRVEAVQVPKRVSDRTVNVDGRCDAKVVAEVSACKTYLDLWSSGEFGDARLRSNPYERIGKAIFQNRAAVKMAEMDHVFDLTGRGTGPGGQLRFADICAGPGGFTEYVMWRHKELGARGWGFTIKGDHDFRLDRFNPDSPCGNFECCYGADNTGDILKSENIRHFAAHVSAATSGEGLDLVMADGGISVDGVENFQELLTKQLVMCQFLTAMSVLAPGGKFVCKVFDTVTPFLATCLGVLASEFENFTIVKPVTSRPANSEKYVVATGFRRRNPPSVEHLFRVNDALNDAREASKQADDAAESAASTVPDVLLAAPPDVVTPSAFNDYLLRINTSMARHQIRALRDLHKCLEDQRLHGADQVQVAERCLGLWKVPTRRPRSSVHISKEQHRSFRDVGDVGGRAGEAEAEDWRRRQEKSRIEQMDRLSKETRERHARVEREKLLRMEQEQASGATLPPQHTHRHAYEHEHGHSQLPRRYEGPDHHHRQYPPPQQQQQQQQHQGQYYPGPGPRGPPPPPRQQQQQQQYGSAYSRQGPPPGSHPSHARQGGPIGRGAPPGTAPHRLPHQPNMQAPRAANKRKLDSEALKQRFRSAKVPRGSSVASAGRGAAPGSVAPASSASAGSRVIKGPGGSVIRITAPTAPGPSSSSSPSPGGTGLNVRDPKIAAAIQAARKKNP